jgi:hypothetical protein
MIERRATGVELYQIRKELKSQLIPARGDES